MSSTAVHRDPRLRARITRCAPLTYRDGVDASLDRPAHVRAASALAWIGDHLAILQDDANFIALADPRDARVGSIPLPAGPDGRRQFDDLLGNKRSKLDLESCITIGEGSDATIVAFGSGSTPAREQIIIARHVAGAAPMIALVPASRFYATLRDAHDFAGSELNIEGAVLAPDGELHLFARGNGAARDGRLPVNAACSVNWAALWAHLNDQSLAPPSPRWIRRFDLGAVDGIPLGFTDAMRWGRGVLFSAAAEASPDAVRDGPVAGSAIGFISDDGSARCAVAVGEGGRPFRGKVEGLAEGPDARSIYAVVDEDDPATPSELCVIVLEGEWPELR